MNRNQYSAYKKVERLTATPRENEARILTEGAIKLRRCLEFWDSEKRKEMLDEALDYNRRIWSIFHNSLIKPENHLPEELRTNLLKLSIFINRQILKVKIRPAPEKLTPIIDINLNIAKGLKTKPPNAMRR